MRIARIYVIGFVTCLILTMAAYLLVAEHLFDRTVLIPMVVGLALTQVAVQLLCFLNMGAEHKPHWNLMIFLFMLLVLVIVVFGSFWIMSNLNYNTMEM